MPIIKSAIKKVRVDGRRTLVNKNVRRILREVLDRARKDGSVKNISEAARALALSAKKKVIHRNKAARLLSRLVKRSKKR